MIFFKSKSTYRQLVFMFGILMVINFIILMAVLRQLTIEPSAKQMAMFLNMQLDSIERMVEGKNFEEAQTIITQTFNTEQVVTVKQPNAADFPNLKFYRVLAEHLSHNQVLQLKLEESQDNSRIWIKPKWLNEYWLGIAFQPFINNVSRLLLIIIVTLLSLSLIAAYFFSRYMLKPFKQLAQMAVDIVEQKANDNQVLIKGTKEVQEIALLVKSSAQQIRQLNKEKELLLAGVSHDLRTPLARMRLQAEFLSDEEPKENLIQEIQEMDHIIGDFVTYVRSGTIEDFQCVNLIELINESVEQFSQLKQYIEVEVPSVNIEFEVKPLSFKRMLSNIIENAFKYGRAPVQIQIKETQETIKIVIIDHGDGIDEKEILAIFEPFVMANNLNNQYGSGLGLSIVKKLAQQNNAHVFAENHKDGGLCVCIEFSKN